VRTAFVGTLKYTVGYGQCPPHACLVALLRWLASVAGPRHLACARLRRVETRTRPWRAAQWRGYAGVINDVPRLLCLHKFCTSLQRTCCATEWQSQTAASPTRLQTQNANVFAYCCSWAVVHEALLRGQTSRLRPRCAGLCGRCRAAPSDAGFVEVTQAPFPLYLDAARDALQHTPPYV